MCTMQVEMCPLEAIRDAALTVHGAGKCVRFLYVPLPALAEFAAWLEVDTLAELLKHSGRMWLPNGSVKNLLKHNAELKKSVTQGFV